MKIKYSSKTPITLKFNGKVFTFRRKFGLKSKAVKFAKNIRSSKRASGRSYNARVIKLADGYGVYSNRKK